MDDLFEIDYQAQVKCASHSNLEPAAPANKEFGKSNMAAYNVDC